MRVLRVMGIETVLVMFGAIAVANEPMNFHETNPAATDQLPAALAALHLDGPAVLTVPSAADIRGQGRSLHVQPNIAAYAYRVVFQHAAPNQGAGTTRPGNQPGQQAICLPTNRPQWNPYGNPVWNPWGNLCWNPAILVRPVCPPGR